MASGLPDLGLRYLLFSCCVFHLFTTCAGMEANTRENVLVCVQLNKIYPYLSIFDSFSFSSVRQRAMKELRLEKLSDFYERSISSRIGYAVPSS